MYICTWPPRLNLRIISKLVSYMNCTYSTQLSAVHIVHVYACFFYTLEICTCIILENSVIGCVESVGALSPTVLLYMDRNTEVPTSCLPER